MTWWKMILRTCGVSASAIPIGVVGGLVVAGLLIQRRWAEAAVCFLTVVVVSYYMSRWLARRFLGPRLELPSLTPDVVARLVRAGERIVHGSPSNVGVGVAPDSQALLFAYHNEDGWVFGRVDHQAVVEAADRLASSGEANTELPCTVHTLHRQLLRWGQAGFVVERGQGGGVHAVGSMAPPSPRGRAVRDLGWCTDEDAERLLAELEQASPAVDWFGLLPE